MSVASLYPGPYFGFDASQLAVAIGMGTFVAGITWFARFEATVEQRLNLVGGIVVMLIGLSILASFPQLPAFADGQRALAFRWSGVWPLTVFVLGLSTIRRCVLAAAVATPTSVQTAVKQCILSLIVFDAAISMAVCSSIWWSLSRAEPDRPVSVVWSSHSFDLSSIAIDFMFLGYNTNGFAHHAIDDALSILAEIGYQGVGLTLDHHVLNPYCDEGVAQRKHVKRQLIDRKLRSVVETGARFLLDPHRKHQPTLVSRRAEDRSRRIEFLKRAIETAVELESDCVSLWSGAADDDADAESVWCRLIESLLPVVEYAGSRQVVLAFEPEPGMWVDGMGKFAELLHRADAPLGILRLTMDIGHLHCQNETPIETFIERWAGALSNIHIEDMRRGVHEHLMFGEGEIEFAPVLKTLRQVAYASGLYVELSRHSHQAPTVAKAAFDFLHPLLRACSFVGEADVETD